MKPDAKVKLLALAEGPTHSWPSEHPTAVTSKHVAEIAGRALQTMPGIWPVEELEQGLLVLAGYATQGELVYELACRANHACAPNAHWHITDGKLAVLAARPIAAGAEVTVSYATGLALLHWQARHRFLWDTRGFICGCGACAVERSAEEAACVAGVASDLAEPDAEPDGELTSYASSEPEAEMGRVPRSAPRPNSLPPLSHLRCVRCVPQAGPDGRMLDQGTYMRWLADPMSIPILQRVGKARADRRAVVGPAWRCVTCGLSVDLLGENLNAMEQQAHALAQVEMQLTYQALEHYSVKDSAKLMELWPTCERLLGPWHGVTLFCASQALPLLREDRAYKVRARLAVAGMDDRFIISCAQ